MAVLLETSAGAVVVDLFAERCPRACENFVKLCKLHYFDGHLFFDVQRNYWMRTGDPTATGTGGQSVFSMLENAKAQGDDRDRGSRFFQDEIVRGAKLDRRGLVCMAAPGKDQNGSCFLITMTAHGLEHLNGKRTIFGEIAEGLESTLATINDLQVDDKYRPLRDVRILCTHVLDDPFPDPAGMPAAKELPAGARPPEEAVEPRIDFNENVDEDEGFSPEELEKRNKMRDAKARAVVLEMVGDLPDADVKPPENVLFVCKLNAATQEDDLELIFSRFGEVKSCEIIRDKETGDSLQYAFIEFGNEAQCQEAFFKMNNVMIDDRRIKVDFSQSVSKIWNDARRGARRRLPPSFSTGRDERSHARGASGRRGAEAAPHRPSGPGAARGDLVPRGPRPLAAPFEPRKKRSRLDSSSSEDRDSDSLSSLSSQDRRHRRRDRGDRKRHRSSKDDDDRKHRKKHKSHKRSDKKSKSKKDGRKHDKKHKKHKSRSSSSRR